VTAWRAFSCRTIDAMNDDERAILMFEEQYPRNDRSKEAAVRDVLGISWVRYRQRLLQLVRRRDVLEEFPIVAHRVIRTTDAGVRARAARTFAA
jgi:hypothetical protein